MSYQSPDTHCRAECEQLHEQVLLLKQQNEELRSRSSSSDSWFTSVRTGLVERQRVLDAVYRSKCSWDDVGAAVLEVLSNDFIWDAVERSAGRRSKEQRLARGLEALFAQLETLDERVEHQRRQTATLATEDDAANQVRPMPPRRRRSSSDPARLIPCRVCCGAGFIDPTAATAADDNDDPDAAESDSYLRKTLAQVLELRATLERAGERSQELESELQTTTAEAAVVKTQLDAIEFIRRHGVDQCVQVDLDSDDGDAVDLDAIMRASADELDTGTARKKFASARSVQYEHLIVELKSSLDEKDAAISELRRAHADVQERLRSRQLASQSEQEAHWQELATLKTALATVLRQQNSAIEVKQAEVALVLQQLGEQRSAALSLGGSDGDTRDGDSDNDDDDHGEGEEEGDDLLALDDSGLETLDDVTRSEAVARRYSQAIVRVQHEYESQKSLLQQSEAAASSDDERRTRTNSITLGRTVVSVASHPRELFKALSTAQSELLSVRRASQRASTLQTDRLLTLTTHLGHLSEELCMVRKRTKAEIAFWKLECEKTQNASNAAAADFERARLELHAAHERRVSAAAAGASSPCTLCEQHQARLMVISSELLLNDAQHSLQEPSADADMDQLTPQEHSQVSHVALELETLYATMSAFKQEAVRRLVAATLLGDDVAGQASVRATKASVGRRSMRTTESPLAVSPSALRAGRQQATESRLVQSSGQGQGSDVRTLVDVADGAVDASVDSLLSVAPHTRTGSSGGSSRTSFDTTLGSQPHSDMVQRSTIQNDAGLSVNGMALNDMGVWSNDDGRTSSSSGVFAPSHRKKKIVRKILSEDQVLRRRYTNARLHALDSDNNNARPAPVVASDLQPHRRNESDEATGESRSSSGVLPSYLDPNGLEVFYEDVEVEASDDDDKSDKDKDNDDSSAAGNQAGEAVVESSGVNNDGVVRAKQAAYVHRVASTSDAAAHQNHETLDESALQTERNGITNDPHVITHLRALVQQHASVKETLAVANWRVLICHVRALSGRDRLDCINHESKRVHKPSSQRAAVEPFHATVKRTMQRLVELRESHLDAEIRARGEWRNQSRQVQTRLIESVSTILTTVSCQKSVRAAANDSSSSPSSRGQRWEPGSPRKYPPVPNRTLYPAAQVNLSGIPSTQQIPTSHFPGATLSVPTSPQLRAEVLLRSRPVSASAETLRSGVVDVESLSVFEDDNRFPVSGDAASQSRTKVGVCAKCVGGVLSTMVLHSNGQCASWGRRTATTSPSRTRFRASRGLRGPANRCRRQETPARHPGDVRTASTG